MRLEHLHFGCTRPCICHTALFVRSHRTRSCRHHGLADSGLLVDEVPVNMCFQVVTPINVSRCHGCAPQLAAVAADSYAEYSAGGLGFLLFPTGSVTGPTHIALPAWQSCFGSKAKHPQLDEDYCLLATCMGFILVIMSA